MLVFEWFIWNCMYFLSKELKMRDFVLNWWRIFFLLDSFVLWDAHSLVILNLWRNVSFWRKVLESHVFFEDVVESDFFFTLDEWWMLVLIDLFGIVCIFEKRVENERLCIESVCGFFLLDSFVLLDASSLVILNLWWNVFFWMKVLKLYVFFEKRVEMRDCVLIFH